MEIWLEKKDCTGCGACQNICPKGAIKMDDDGTGFKYPIIDRSKCIDCSICKKTCPIVNKPNRNKLEKKEVYAGWSKDEETRYTSTSGGMFTEITKPIILNNGYVVGASYNEENMVEHRVAKNMKQLETLKQSKYLQSDTSDIYKRTKKMLENNETVAFCGSPCQIAGLYNFLKKDYINLLTIEFICRGMNSPKAYHYWLKEIEIKEDKKVKKVWFKYKVNGWKASPRCTRIDFKDNTYKIYDGNQNLYMKGYLESNLYIRPSCGNCKFNGLDRQADITLADFWGIKKELDDDKGTSLILVNTENGRKYFDMIKDNIYFEKRTVDEIYEGNVCFTKSVEVNKKSEEFLNNLNDNNFSELIAKYGKISFVKKFLNKSKKVMKKIIKVAKDI